MSLETNLAKLPETCFATLPSDGSLILIKRGEEGYFPTEGYTTNDLFPTFADVANLLNDQRGVSRPQRMAMEYGSVFGWDLPIADVDKHIVPGLIEKVREVPGAEEIADAIVKMQREGCAMWQIVARFNRLLDEARPDLAAKFRENTPTVEIVG